MLLLDKVTPFTIVWSTQSSRQESTAAEQLGVCAGRGHYRIGFDVDIFDDACKVLYDRENSTVLDIQWLLCVCVRVSKGGGGYEYVTVCCVDV